MLRERYKKSTSFFSSNDKYVDTYLYIRPTPNWCRFWKREGGVLQTLDRFLFCRLWIAFNNKEMKQKSGFYLTTSKMNLNAIFANLFWKYRYQAKEKFQGHSCVNFTLRCSTIWTISRILPTYVEKMRNIEEWYKKG